MTKAEMMVILEALEDDVTVWDRSDGILDVTVEDFDGFDEDWCEMDREYTHPELVEEFLDLLEELPHEDDFYIICHLDDCDMQVGFGSFDI